MRDKEQRYLQHDKLCSYQCSKSLWANPGGDLAFMHPHWSFSCRVHSWGEPYEKLTGQGADTAGMCSLRGQNKYLRIFKEIRKNNLGVPLSSLLAVGYSSSVWIPTIPTMPERPKFINSPVFLQNESPILGLLLFDFLNFFLKVR